ncbi:hypothetical protein ACFWCB_15350 [Streptomyces sp. NPDC060048]|uniref:hypothetical protein n=1 Tax=unclassified Streptomyces TaxID=2593676 RepID=UPI0036843597
MNRTEQPGGRRGSGETEDPWQHLQQVLRAMDRLLEVSTSGPSRRGRRAGGAGSAGSGAAAGGTPA